MNFWQQLTQSNRPFFVLAPMDDVTDVVFRQLVAEVAPPDVLVTEFVSVAGLASPGRERTLERLRLQPDHSRPTMAQIYGNVPEQFEAAARDIVTLGGFAGIDINMGCPDKNVVKHGSGGGLIGQFDLTRDIIAATKAGAGELPVSVKTRLGLRTIQTEEWAGFLLRQNLAALAIHGRTVKEMSKVAAHWDEIAKVVALRDQLAPGTPVIGNGDIASHAEGVERATQTGVDGLMVGRGIFHNIHLFDGRPTGAEPHPAEQLRILRRHLELYGALKSQKPYVTLKRFFKIYINGWPGAADLRAQLMETRTIAEAQELLSLYTTKSALPEPTSVSNR